MNPDFDIRFGDAEYPSYRLVVQSAELLELEGQTKMLRKIRNGFPQALKALASDGFIHTGDLAILDIDGDFSIVGRVKDTIVLSGGENIEPVPIENALKESEYIDTAVVIGQDEKYLGALIVINEKNVERYLKENHIPYVNRENLKDMEEIRHLINSELARLVNSSKGFKSYEQVSRFALLEKPFTVGRELSAKQEVKRAEVMKLYKEEVESIFR